MTTPYTDTPEFDTAASQISNCLFEINNDLVSLSRQIKSLGKADSGVDSVAFDAAKTRTVALIGQLNDSFKGLRDATNAQKALIEDLEAGGVELTTTQSFTRNKLMREVKASLAEFSNLQKTYNEVNLRLNEESRVAMAQTEEEEPQESQQLIIEHEPLNAEELEYHQNLVEQREREIAQIQHGVDELNEIFRDLGTIVTEQGTMVDNIESNLYTVADETRMAGRELHKALRYQRRSGGRSCCLLLILSVVMGVVMLAMFA
ncbi:hypothetical protein BABINDRAFT_159817 [Babjeviella inositovora NRRL Y-12698]|uniref:t-SNARE coiled-coil homology domain-containing protein n=1 Tax=Babjeviella inositovora NRRL Y-12698 TaxID=984486 RepID=A0A1E3QV45_9ASCO|nr:uncharacterized protein BABINDRAFT_159817 [Babjeviella inositovora NRRL Y-12698]ODQ81541.1 hypothetical protein BABINDRAFT_159817 [Babjeviella inositovora NRRL Y-12698]